VEAINEVVVVIRPKFMSLQEAMLGKHHSSMCFSISPGP
jgi:hypothetical protein